MKIFVFFNKRLTFSCFYAINIFLFRTICANNDQIIVTDSDSSIVKTGAMAPYEFVQLVKSHVKPDIITMLEQYI